MKLKLVWENTQNKLPFEEDMLETVRRCILAALKEEEFDYDTELNLLLVDNEEIREINREQRAIDRATDVLSFPMLEEEDGELVIYDEDITDGFVLLGDIVLSLERAAQQAAEYGHSLQREVGFLTVHSVLHLLGYDHEQGEAAEKEMFAKQEKILNTIGLGR